MIPLEEAQEYVQSLCARLPRTVLPLREAHGLVMVDAVTSSQQIPPFANTAVDGFAVRSQDVSSASDTPVELTVVDTLAAGAAPAVAVGPDQAIRIMTGAPLPEGADAIVMVEDSEMVNDTTVRLSASVSSGAHVRGAGEDVQPGDEVFAPDTTLSPGHLGVLASLGVYEVGVTARPRVGVFSTGDELIEGAQELQPGQIRDSNRHSLIAMVEAANCTAVDMGILPDDADVIRNAVAAGAQSYDALITSGGVSMGDFDYVKMVLDELGEMRWMQVAIKPAKPLAFGLVGDTPIFGLPGNPVSSMVSFELFARPGLRKMMGHTHLYRPRRLGVTSAPLRRHTDGKTHFARVVVDGNHGVYNVRSAGGQGSHQLTAMAGATALAVLPDGDGLDDGDAVEFFHLGSNLA